MNETQEQEMLKLFRVTSEWRQTPEIIVSRPTADDIVALAKPLGGVFYKMGHFGVPEDMTTHDKIEYRILKSDDSIPDWVGQIIASVKSIDPQIKFLIGHEQGKTQLDVMVEKLEAMGNAGKKAVRGLVIAAGVVLTLAAVASIIAAAGILLVGALAVLAVASLGAVDPKVIAVVGEEEEWVCLATWYERA